MKAFFWPPPLQGIGLYFALTQGPQSNSKHRMSCSGTLLVGWVPSRSYARDMLPDPQRSELQPF